MRSWKSSFIVGCILLAPLAACRADLADPEAGSGPGGQGTGWLYVPVAVDFGIVDWVDLPEAGLEQTLAVENRGEAELHLTAIQSVDDLGFSVDLEGGLTLAAGQAAEVLVRLEPQGAGVFWDKLRFEVDGVVDDRLETALRAEVHVGRLGADPVDFGEVPQGCVATATLPLRNEGDAALVVGGLEAEALDLEAATALLPARLEVGGSLELPLTWAPLSEDGPGELRVLLEELPEAEAEVVLTGEVVPPEAASTSKVVPHWRSADLLVHWDCSARQAVGAQLPALSHGLLEAMVDDGLSPRLAYLVEDSGCVRGDTLFVDGSFSESEAEAVADEMLAVGRAYGADCERAFQLFDRALTADAPGQCNEGLFQEDGLRHLVSISDEHEQSSLIYSTAVAMFQAPLLQPDLLRMHAIGGDYPTGCHSELASAGAYSNYYEATVATEGMFASICDPLDDAVQELADTVRDAAAEVAISGRTVDLGVPGDTVNAESIVVEVDGVVLDSAGWTWDEDAVFVVDAPAEGATIEVRWEVLPECGG